MSVSEVNKQRKRYRAQTISRDNQSGRISPDGLLGDSLPSLEFEHDGPCLGCGAVLSRYNDDEWCASCVRPDYGIT